MDSGDDRRLLRLVETQRDLVQKLMDVTSQIQQQIQAAHVARPPKTTDPRVKAFLVWFQAEYKQQRAGADYCVSWGKHGALVKEMLWATSYERLQTLAKILLSEKTDDEFIMDSDRGIEILKAKFNWLSDRLAHYEANRRGRT